ncbi:hypothetical protein KGF56_001165 [Candida oxycetoniae]|uniref:Cell wall mannoprotein PIR1-like C-terminal domain-containing protein n=1 Tax=Candida oxycetoniae TaxID=497107 RepID=A0AAI9SZA4_9ASCO|nr:uncharacterized protein KGF56_001165 [Candida oxycetoniae]KAI3405946.1 hypothetical protein KGF56_001165 [Candida oxycetoniae]
MKFSSTIALSIISVASASIISPCCNEPITTFEGEFALGIVELCDPGTIYLAYENECGQLEHNCETYDCGCNECVVTLVADAAAAAATPTPTPLAAVKVAPTAVAAAPIKVAERGGVETCPVKLCDLCYPYCTIDENCVDYFTLCDTVLKDAQYRIGQIACNHELIFTYPVEYNALYTCGWSIVFKDCYYVLALNGCTTFWECPVDNCGTYKIFDESIDCACKPVEIVIIFKTCD